MSKVLPVDRLLDTDTLIAFYHPAPSYQVHILLVPKRAIADLSSITPDDSAFLSELFQSVRILVDRYDLDLKGYRLIANGGKYQTLPYLHFHLISE